MTQRLIPVYPPDERRGASGGLIDSGPTPAQGVIVTRFRSTAKLDTGQHRNLGSGVALIIVGANPLRRVITVRNEGAVDIYIGGEGVTVTTGFRIGIGQSITLETGGDIFAITPSGTGVVFWLAEIEAS